MVAMEICQELLRVELQKFATSAIREELMRMKENLVGDLLDALPKACADASQYLLEASETEASPRAPPVLEPAGKHCAPNMRASQLGIVASSEGPSFHPLTAVHEHEEAVLPAKRATSLYARVSKDKATTLFGMSQSSVQSDVRRASRMSIHREYHDPSNLVVARQESRNMQVQGFRGLQQMAQEVIASAAFEVGAVGAVVLNIMWIGVQTDWVGRNWRSDTPWYFSLIDMIFAALTVAELTTRIMAIGLPFFYDANWKWNWFDLFICLSQVVEVAATSLASGSSGGMKNMRLIKMVRIARVARIAVAFPELNILMSSIVQSVQSLFWVLILIFMFLYAVAVLITQLVSDHKLGIGRDKMHHGEGEVLISYFDTLDLTIISLYKVISGGIDWGDLSSPLEEQISPNFKYFFVVFVGFQIFAMLNVITANFVDNASKLSVIAQAEGQVAALWDMLGHIPVEEGEEDPFSIDLTNFMQYYNHPTMLNFREVIHAEDMDCVNLFKLFDMDGDGSISAPEFLQMSAELIGPAKATSLAKLSMRVGELTELTESKLDELRSVVEQQHEEAMERWPFKSQVTAEKMK